MDRGSGLQQEGTLLSPSPLLSQGTASLPPLLRPAPLPRSLLTPFPAQGPAPSAAGAGISGAESQHPPPLPACPRAYLAVTTQVIPIVQPLALGDGELVPPLHEVAQSYVHLPIEDPAWRRREGGRGRVVLGEPSRRGRSHTS